VRPLPRDADRDQEIVRARDRYVLRPPDENDCSRMDLYRNGELIHGYTAKPTPRPLDYFASVVEDSYRPDATFMNSLLAVRTYADRSVVIFNQTVIEAECADFQEHRLHHRGEIPETVERYFSIPREIVEEAISGLGELGSAWN
jgi:hypothetical protein